MAEKILIMGLPGSGKTTLAIKLCTILRVNATVLSLNADELRKKYSDWDFTIDGRLRQAQRMYNFSVDTECDFVVCDFVAPIPKSRGIFAPDYTIWLNTLIHSRYEDTNRLFLDPPKWDYRIKDFKNFNTHVHNIISELKIL